MILQCPNCGDQYEIQSKGDLAGFTMKCDNCGYEISTENEIKVNRLQNDNDETFGFFGTSTRNSKSRIKWIWVIVAAALVMMIFTKPEKSKHVEKIREIAMEFVSEKASSEGDAFSEGLAMLLGPFLINQILEMGLQIDDYIFFNVGRIKYEDVDRTITIGAFNCVFTLSNPHNVKSKPDDDSKDEKTDNLDI